MKVLVIIITYNGKHWVDHCLGSLTKSTLTSDVLIIDNRSTDGTPEYIEKNFPEFELNRSDANLGFGKANNVGLQKAIDEDYDYVFLLNQDAWIEPDTIKILVDIHQQHPEYGIISPMHLNKEKTSLDTKFSHFVSRSENKKLMSDLLLPNGHLRDVYTLDFVNAAAWLIPRECLKTVGGFDPLFPHYGEDNDFINRAIYYGFKIGFTPNTSIVHDREGYLKQPDMHRSLAKQYTDRLRLLKNIHLSFGQTLFSVLKEEIYYAMSALLKLDLSLFFIKVRLIRRIISQRRAIQKSRKYCMNTQTAYLK
ncbi:glycosyltransferase family 2 protein [Catalinimonas niigatensis]|uniref:glycosyltransferase family 2 protein n=1 Tax=Catalinimonas niigatensis TaxID=1397264 RepID=UPI0026662351|nr:glycosyltransferase family 2 protein [Catalinimonas niigatensis]WPP53319.1 glycosyltransferase family 2 protein [Catalinimonas niigatensis]